VTDVFEEVESQLRTERYLALAKRALPWVTALVVTVIVGGWRRLGLDELAGQPG